MDRADVIWRNKIRSWAAKHPDCLRLDRVELYEPCRVAGIVRRLRLDPMVGELRATITDGTSSVSASWTLSRHMPQLKAAPGTGLILEGMARIDESGDIVFVEPTIEIVEGSEGQVA